MSKLYIDIFYLLFQKLEGDQRTLYSCLSVNKTVCKIIMPILWKNPWKFLKKKKEKLLLDVIISHSSDESRNKLSQVIDFLTNSYQRPLFNYISFCRHLNLNRIIRIINTHISIEYNDLIRNEIINLFINENTKFTHLYISDLFDCQIHLIPGAKHCFSKIKFLSCSTRMHNNMLIGLTEIIKTIKELELFIHRHFYVDLISKLIETPKELSKVHFRVKHHSIINYEESSWNTLENLLIKHANTIEYFSINKQPAANILSYFVNLKILELSDVSLLASLIENSGTYLNEIKIIDDKVQNDSNKRNIQAIYQNCPKLKYLKMEFLNYNMLELENLLINCQYLNGLFIRIREKEFDWNKLFEILTKLSPTNLYKFKFKYYSHAGPKLEYLKLFFDNWKDRHPMLLQIKIPKDYSDLIEKYKAKGIIKKYDDGFSIEDF
ncbi:hypothetical protein C1645_832120 [Glomus cerebriforme]|uniref:F-box domain-containing protein n=1 Tax=Glomus cerebriforme TaxID=658196 RepID=A0A397SG61_9GLOM|nr:hypothetical protein C1645_832120 [Glomus cerebriforme]